MQAPALAAAEVDGTRLTSLGAIVMDFETGMVLYEHNADVRRGPASMTKMMTVYLVYEAIANGQFDFDTIVPISQVAYNYSRTPGETNVPLTRTRQYTVDELLDVIIVMSAGGACAALAELVAGTMRAFHRMMNDKAAEWGIDAVFFSVSGGVTHTQMTPRAMAEITRRTIMDFPEVLEKTAMDVVNWRGRPIPATNHLLGVYEGIDGFKTGTHPQTRANFAGTALRGDIRIISVTMGSSSGRRFPDTVALLDYGFAVMEAYWAAIEARKVAPGLSPIVVNGFESGFVTFDIEGGRYYSLRDIAHALDGTKAQFGIGYDEELDAVVLTGGISNAEAENMVPGEGGELYVNGDELSGSDGGHYANGYEQSENSDESPEIADVRKLPEPLSSGFLINGVEVDLTAFDIEGDIYIRPLDIAALLGFELVWRLDGGEHVMNIDTGEDPPPVVVQPPPSQMPVPPQPTPLPSPPAEEEPEDEFKEPVPLVYVFSVVAGLLILGAVTLVIRRNSAAL